MRSIGNDLKSSSSASSITQTHLDDLEDARDIHQATAIAAEVAARNTAIITAVATETAARNTAISNETAARNAALTTVVTNSEAYTDAGMGILDTSIKADGYFDKIITTTANISNMGFTNPDAAFAQKNHANVLSYALLQAPDGETSINTANGKKINLKVDNTTKATITATKTIFNNEMTIKNTTISDAGWGSHTSPLNMASFSHKDMDNTTDYALMQQSDGTTYINAPSGSQITFRINNDPIANFTETAANFNNEMTIKNATISDAGFASNMASFSHKDMDNITDYGFMQDPNGTTYINAPTGNTIMFRINNNHVFNLTDTMAYFSVPLNTTTAVMNDAGFGSNYAAFSHNAIGSGNTYGFMHNIWGDIYVNCSEGRVQSFRSDNIEIVEFSTTAAHFTTPITGTSDLRFKKNITIPSPSKNWNDFKLIKIKQYNKVYPNINSDKLRIGVIAQELESIDNPICKNAVRKISIGKPTDPVELDIYKQGKIFTDDRGEERSGGFRSVEYEQLYRMNLIITQQLMARVEALEAALTNV